jgi:hypothetical protein
MADGSEARAIIAGPSPMMWSFIAFADERPERDENAEYIVRAVNSHADLVAACKLALVKLRETSQYVDGHQWAVHLAVRLRAAIAKTEGVGA